MQLVDEDFAAMLAGEPYVRDGVAAPPGGVDEAAVLTHVRAILARLRAEGYRNGQWMVVSGGEAVGLCGYKHPPSPAGEVEIGYGMAPARRRRGFATRAVALMVEEARNDPSIRFILAETAEGNVASQRVLEKNGFECVGTRFDACDEKLILWRMTVRACPA